jgi:hypothetical protein
MPAASLIFRFLEAGARAPDGIAARFGARRFLGFRPP